MLIWMLSGLSVAAFFAVLIIRNAEADDKRRKLTKRPLPNNWV
jgi:hypothetical protein